MQANPALTRQAMACGYLPPVESSRSLPVVPWSFPMIAKDAPKPTICVGYLQRLPELHEIARARLHWSKGSISAFTGNEPVSEELLIGIEVLDSSSRSVEDWRVTKKEEGGGA